MSALTMTELFNAVPWGQPVPDGVLVFPAPVALAWLIGAALAVCCALLGAASARSAPAAAGAAAAAVWRAVRRDHRRAPRPSGVHPASR